jgi:hypothetical protein
MAWVDQRDVVKQHLGLATAALERATADPAVSRDVVEALEELRAMGVALAKLASVGSDAAVVDDEKPTKR